MLRRLAGDDPEVNEEWNCDKGRWAFTYATQGDRITTPLLRDADGSLRPASWSEAVAVALRGLTAAAGRAGVLVGGRVTFEDAYGYAKFARIVLNTNDIDFRARAHQPRRTQFLAHAVAGRPSRSPTPTWRPRRSWCSPVSTPKRSRRSCSCGCARPSASTACG